MPLPPDILVNKQTNNQTENTLRILHVCTCSFQTCLITDRVESFQQRDDLSSATSLSAGSFALAAHLKKQCWVLLHVDTMSVYWTKNFTLYAMPHFFFFKSDLSSVQKKLPFNNYSRFQSNFQNAQRQGNFDKEQESSRKPEGNKLLYVWDSVGSSMPI